ncbi:MAG: ATP-binding cassette domain-containing protein [Anaerovoracaceae bacterium]|jgi:putative ABC transport system permease protein
MIQLKNVSKFYYSKGMITSGFTKVNLELNIGEFVVITGESGSGKTTLLNVISGLDTYEEGEMYVDGSETSHFTTSDFEEYRKKYIGNIFQNFNLVNSYTVYQNVELILLINGYDKDEIKRIVPGIIEKVGLAEYSGTKVSRLSGGQKQRVSIARALAKDTPVIVADEPTGNLDSRSAEDVVRLLADIARDKLVIVVTHNYEQFAPYATRVVRMSDGRIIEDKAAGAVTGSGRLKESYSDTISNAGKIRLGVRNAFNIVPKFILLLIVFLFVVFSVSSVYTNFKQTQEQNSLLGYNDFFTNTSNDRIVVKKDNGTAFSDADYRKIKKIDGVAGIEKDDVILDSDIYIEKGELSVYGYPYSIKAYHGGVDVGRMPQGSDEVLLAAPDDDPYIIDHAGSIVGKSYKMEMADGAAMRVVVSGIRFIEDADAMGTSKIYLPDSKLDQLRNAAYLSVSSVETLVNGKACKYAEGDEMYKVVANSHVPRGGALVPDELNSYYEQGGVRGHVITVSVSNLYYKDKIDLKVNSVYSRKTFRQQTGLKSYDDHAGDIFINPKDYASVFYKGTYQSSVFAKNTRDVDGIVTRLKADGFKPLALKDALANAEDADTMLDVVRIPFTILLVIAIFFIAYFVIRLILKSRDVYFSILRMLGLARKNARRLLDIELFVVINIAYGIFLLVTQLTRAGIIKASYVQTLVTFLTLRDYLILYVVLVIIALLISGRFARKLFARSAMDAYRGEA